ncbi:methyltransferase domain-containing protein [Paenibacillus xylanilyticus]|uniref:Methyltransferase domain-containing protein n=1 Tax=Paenibacillus xylanilyticus TaxID=248903 RepID=A0A7Y6BXN2_9BACL|nr:methyltransferase domain-containing protein [Paenibacillus xylanilyticus]NUU76473.1 methyltransferase domain-containing protein [Paenibacillus xylanilyticus]
MSEYYWDNKIEYLRNTRGLYYNDDYLQFLVQSVWKITKPVSVLDYGCGFGYLGLKLLPLLPPGSSYTGLDKGDELINEAKETFANLPFQTEFISCDIENAYIEQKYDIAVSHAFLLHMDNSVTILQKMMESVKDQGKVICFEPHWIGNMANCHLEGTEQSELIKLGVLQKLFENDYRRTGKDGNIGMRLPILMSQLGLTDVESRMSDKVNFFDQNMDMESKNVLYDSLREEGIGQEPGDPVEIMDSLLTRELQPEEAREQYEAELMFSKKFKRESWLSYAPSMKISFGTVQRA